MLLQCLFHVAGKADGHAQFSGNILQRQFPAVGDTLSPEELSIPHVLFLHDPLPPNVVISSLPNPAARSPPDKWRLDYKQKPTATPLTKMA